ncbi:MAG TPA: hypothetical protein VGD08_22825 [Stellaceae bacterium]|jgi:hypothetical protein
MVRELICPSPAMGGAILAVMLAVAGGLPAAAEESGQWFGRAVIVTVSSKTVNVGDRADHIISVSETDGVVFNGDGKPFLDKARYQIADWSDGATRIGYKTFTETDGSKVFAKYTLKEAKLPDLHGVFEFTGGTGKYAGITGHGEYHVVLVSDTAAWDELHGEYSIPAAASGSSTPPAAPGMTTSTGK